MDASKQQLPQTGAVAHAARMRRKPDPTVASGTQNKITHFCVLLIGLGCPPGENSPCHLGSRSSYRALAKTVKSYSLWQHCGASPCSGLGPCGCLGLQLVSNLFAGLGPCGCLGLVLLLSWLLCCVPRCVSLQFLGKFPRRWGLTIFFLMLPPG